MNFQKFEKRTDLAIEVRESFPKDNIEIEGVVLEEESYRQGNVLMSTVEIKDQKGALQMKKPVGRYVTLEFKKDVLEKAHQQNELQQYAGYICRIIQKMLQEAEKKQNMKCKTVLVSGLGNRFATPDALGPYVIEHIVMNRHVTDGYGRVSSQDCVALCGISPGVMAQTGMETGEILHGLVEKIKPDALLVIDSLASRSVNRLCRTVQITNTGISPGAGIGNNRKKVNQETMGIPVIAVGVPTVVDAGTIIYESLENALEKEGYTEYEIESFFQSITNKEVHNLFVTPKDIDEEIRMIGKMIAFGIQKLAE
ncbi:MAG: GPR endopeptidase [Butyribacter sp.]|nr:GPR endopeptidase [bacterium]MDY3855221.1 GPR endopeptidase [Butyribacter sp.]